MEEQSRNNSPPQTEFPLCPRCGSRMGPFRLGIRCPSGACSFWIPREIRQKALSLVRMKELAEKRETGYIDGFHEKGSDRTFSAKLYIGEDGKIRFRLHDATALRCPKCGGMLARFDRGYRCVEQSGCGYVLWKRFAGKELTEEEMLQLLTAGRTGIVDGLISKKSGRHYAAAIVMRAHGIPGVAFDEN